jgi:hypothetical protein
VERGRGIPMVREEDKRREVESVRGEYWIFKV